MIRLLTIRNCEMERKASCWVIISRETVQTYVPISHTFPPSRILDYFYHNNNIDDVGTNMGHNPGETKQERNLVHQDRLTLLSTYTFHLLHTHQHVSQSRHTLPTIKHQSWIYARVQLPPKHSALTGRLSTIGCMINTPPPRPRTPRVLPEDLDCHMHQHATPPPDASCHLSLHPYSDFDARRKKSSVKNRTACEAPLGSSSYKRSEHT